jgi:hypothetical protein
MEIDAMLCNHAEASSDGRLYITGAGIVMSFVPPQGPFAVNLALGATIRIPYTATNQPHKLEVVISHEDGDLVQGVGPDGSSGDLRIQMDFNVGRPPGLPAGGSQSIPVAVNMAGLVVPKLGGYSFVMSIDGSEVKRLPLNVTAVADFPRMGPTAIP